MAKEKKEKETVDPVEAANPLYVAVEDKRTVFSKQYNLARILNIVVLAVTLIVCIVAFVLFQNNLLIALAIILVAVIAAYVYSAVRKKKMDKKTNEFIEFFYSTTTKYVFGDEMNYSDVVSHTFEKLDGNEFSNSGFVTNVTHLGSRNCIYGLIGGLNFKAADAVARVTNNNVEETAFLGKYFMVQLDNVVDGKTLIYVSPEKNDGSGPNDLEGLEVVDNLGFSSRIKVWSSSSNIKEMINEDVIKAVEAFEPNLQLEDVCFCIKSNALYVALSYTNDMMVLPLLDHFKLHPVLQYKEDIEKLSMFVKTLRKTTLKPVEKKKTIKAKKVVKDEDVEVISEPVEDVVADSTKVEENIIETKAEEMKGE